MNTNRRHFSRIAFHAPADLITGKGQEAAVVLDLSLKGALVRLTAGHKVTAGENCTLRVRLGDLDASIRMQGVITHVEGLCFGLACRDIDLDSVTHLRRLVELNLGEPALLERELSALVGDE
jgi:hypothetical protein